MWPSSSTPSRGANSGAVSYVGIPGTRPTIEFMPAMGVSDYALTLGGYNTVNGVDVVPTRPRAGGDRALSQQGRVTALQQGQ